MAKGRRVKSEPMPSMNANFSPDLLGRVIRAKRTGRGWSIDKAAEHVGLTRKTVMKIEHGDSAVTFSNVLKLMDVFGLTFNVRDLNYLLHSGGANNNAPEAECGEWYE